MAQAQASKGAAPASIAVKIVNPLIAAVSETFELMFDAEVERTGLNLRPAKADYLDYSAIIGVSGSAQGSFCVSLAENTAVEAVSRFTGAPAEPGSQLVSDGVGELTNVIIGGMKDRLSVALNLGIPNVICGENYKVDFPPQATPMRITFDSDLGPLFIDFGFVCSTL